MAAPIRNVQGNIIGSVVGVTDLSQPNFLDKVTEHRYGKTGGYVLAAPKHRLIVTATDKTRIMTATPAPGVNPLFDQYLAGFEGSGRIVDSRGLEVLSAAKQVPAAAWVLVVRIPSEEVFAPILGVEKRLLLATIFMTLLAGWLTWWMLRRQLAPTLAAAKILSTWSVTDLNPTPLPITMQDEIGDLVAGFNRILQTLALREEGLKESESRFREIFNAVDDAIFIHDAQTGAIINVNQRMCEMYGYSHEQALACGPSDLSANAPPYSPVEAIEKIQLAQTEGPQTFDWLARARDGHLFWTAVSLRFARIGIHDRIVAVIRDVSERKQAEAALRQSEERLRTLTEWTPQALAVHDGKKILFVNPAAIKMFGAKSAQDLVGKSLLEAVSLDSRDVVRASLKNNVEHGGATAIGEIRCRKLDGTAIDIELQGAPIVFDGVPVRLIAMRDVTQSKKDQATLNLQAKRSEALLGLPGAAETMNEPEFLQHGLGIAEQLTDSQIAFVHFVHEDEENIRLTTWSKTTLDSYCNASYDRHYPVSAAGIWADALRQRAPAVINDYASASGKRGLPEGHAHLERVISVPIIEGGLVRMMMGVGNKPQPYTDFDVETTRLVAQALYRIVSKRRSDDAMRQSQESLNEAQRIASTGSYALDTSADHWDSSEELDRLFGITASFERSVQGWEALIHPADRAMMSDYFKNQVVGQHKTFDREYRIIRRDDQTEHWVHGLGRLEFDSEGNLQRMVGTIQDITERKQAERAMQESKESYRTLVEWSPEPLGVHRDGKLLYVNPAATAMFGAKSAQELIGRPILELVHPEFRQIVLARVKEQTEKGVSVPMMEEKFLKIDGTPIDVEVQSRTIQYQGSAAFQVAMRDITAHKVAQERIQTLAFYDQLTALPNRRLLLDRLQQALTGSVRYQRQGALMMVDLDNFKDINDALGHGQGDLLLQEVAKRMGSCIREGDTVARLGADEFVALLEQLDQNPLEAAMDAEIVAHKVLATLRQPYQLNGTEMACTASIGIALFGEQNEDTVEALKRAELALFQAKALGRNTLRFFDPKMQAAVNSRVALEAGLRDAVRQDQLLLQYQPQVTDKGQVTGVEALLRWLDPKRGMVSPAEFIPMAEETGLILPIGNWVLETACKQLAQWASQPGMAHLTVAVNVSAKQVHQRDFVDWVMLTLERTGANPHRLKLELTESLLVEDVEGVIVKMNALMARGVTFSLDDFGTGYSSLAYLQRLPLDQLKIDQGFVRDILINPNDAAIARMVIALAESLGLTVIPEGVETQAQRDFLLGLGCHNFQGYLFSRPLPIDQFEAFVKRG